MFPFWESFTLNFRFRQIVRKVSLNGNVNELCYSRHLIFGDAGTEFENIGQNACGRLKWSF